MTHHPQPSPYRPETAIYSLAATFTIRRAGGFPADDSPFQQRPLVARVGWTAERRAMAAAFRPLRAAGGSLTQPLRFAITAISFRSYNPDIGDGRGFLFAQLRDDRTAC
jgi:uncharacterized protein YdiU (UPF0061 family)